MMIIWSFFIETTVRDYSSDSHLKTLSKMQLGATYFDGITKDLKTVQSVV